MPSHTATGSLATVPGVSVVFAAIRCVRWLMDLHTYTLLELIWDQLGVSKGSKVIPNRPQATFSNCSQINCDHIHRSPKWGHCRRKCRHPAAAKVDDDGSDADCLKFNHKGIHKTTRGGQPPFRWSRNGSFDPGP